MSTPEQNAPYPDSSEQDDAGPKASDRSEERAAGLFMLGVVLFNPLVLSVFDRGADVVLLGVPVLVVYIFFAWSLLIVLLACTVETPFRPEQAATDREAKQAEPADERS